MSCTVRGSPLRWSRGGGALLTGALLLALMLAFSASALAGAEDAPFVRVVDSRFIAGDEPFYFVGANLHVMHGDRARANASATIAAAASDGLRVGRIWALGEGRAGAPQWQRQQRLFRAGPDGWQEEAFVHLDRVVAEAGRQGLRLIVVLSNTWRDYGGIPMYLRWAGRHDAGRYGYRDLFFEDAQIRRWFVAHLRRVVGRRNSVTGVPYRDDPTILAWELQNELHGTPEAAQLRQRWVAQMAREIRALDPNHLIASGLIGYELELERKQWIAMCRLPAVSYCDQHVYPETRLRSRGRRNLERYIDDRVQLAHHVVGKPIVFGEFGFARSRARRRRAQKHDRFLRRLFYDGGNGALVWIYQPTLPWKRRYPVLIDDPGYGGLRGVFRTHARQLRRAVPMNRNRGLGAQQGMRPLAPTHATLSGFRGIHRRWQRLEAGTWRLPIAVDRFYRAWFEEGGTWDGGVLVHAYGRRTGWLEYRFARLPRATKHLLVRARLSSEYPGSKAPVDGVSLVTVRIDDSVIARQQVAPDDGVGRWVEFQVDDLRLVEGLREGVHRLRFVVQPGENAKGVALYGREAPLNREPVEDPGPIELRAFAAPPG